MPVPRPAAALAAAATLSLVLGAGTAGAAPSRLEAPAAKPSTGQFLTKAQWPQGKQYGTWTQTRVTHYRHDPPFCVEKVLPKDRTSFRTFRTAADDDGLPGPGATQWVVPAKSAAAAKKIVSNARDQLKKCGKAYEDANGSQSKAVLKKYASHAVKDGLSIHGLALSTSEVDPFSGDPVTYPVTLLYGIGRDGKWLTVLELALLDEKFVPDGPFTATAKKAVRKLVD